MKYRNAADILPDRLLKEIQEYTSGEAIYIPSSKKRKGWGEGTGAKTFYQKRNTKIKEKYADGATAEELAEEFYLSVETIKRVLFTME